IEVGSLDAAAEQLALAAEMVPDDIRLLDLRADLLESRGRGEEALALRAEVIDREPSWTRLYRHAETAYDHGDPTAARQSLRRLLDRFPGNRWGIGLLALIEMESGDFERAAEFFGLLTEQSSLASDLSNLGVVHLLRRDFDAAVEQFEQALALQPDHLVDVLNLADAYQLGGRHELAASTYRRLLSALADASTIGWEDEMLRAQAHAHLGARQDAVAAIQRAIRSAPAANGNLAFEAALVYVVVGDRTAALVNAEAARQLGRSEHWFALPWFDPIRAELAASMATDELDRPPVTADPAADSASTLEDSR
ncbi:MAG: tetratricopeptide repeat protein, partial [Acidobacteriota bacterium]